MGTDIEAAEGRGMASLFDLAEPRADWGEADLRGMLGHLLSQPLERGSAIIRELLASPAPPLDSLQTLKRLAKVRRAQADGSVPADLWRAVYFAAIAAAARAGHRISDLADDELQAGYRWVLAKPWLDAGLRGLIESVSRG